MCFRISFQSSSGEENPGRSAGRTDVKDECIEKSCELTATMNVNRKESREQQKQLCLSRCDNRAWPKRNLPKGRDYCLSGASVGWIMRPRPEGLRRSRSNTDPYGSGHGAVFMLIESLWCISSLRENNDSSFSSRTSALRSRDCSSAEEMPEIDAEPKRTGTACRTGPAIEPLIQLCGEG